MTGSPFFRLVLLLAGLVLLAIPAWRLTGRAAPAPQQPPARGTDTPVRQSVQLRFTSPLPPETIVVQALGKTVTTLRGPDGPWSVEIPLELPAEGIDLVVNATWPGQSPSNALRIQARVGDSDRLDTTLWGTPDIEDVVTVSGGGQP